MMRIAVSSQGTELSSNVDPRFGRAPYFIIFDTGDESFKVINNEQNVNAAQGAGVQTAQRIAGEKVDMVVSGNLGPRAFQIITAAGVKSALLADGTVSQAVELARNNKLEVRDSANVGGHWM
jgi:predicted Fe-Mo cluster-binding NifX family protein